MAIPPLNSTPLYGHQVVSSQWSWKLACLDVYHWFQYHFFCNSKASNSLRRNSDKALGEWISCSCMVDSNLKIGKFQTIKNNGLSDAFTETMEAQTR